MITITGTIRSILKRKGNEIWSIAPHQTVYEAIERMAEKGVGALLVISAGKAVGIVSERDYARHGIGAVQTGQQRLQACREFDNSLRGGRFGQIFQRGHEVRKIELAEVLGAIGILKES